MLNYLKKTRFKVVDVDIIKYLKQVHTELHEKLEAAVRSVQNKKNN